MMYLVCCHGAFYTIKAYQSVITSGQVYICKQTLIFTLYHDENPAAFWKERNVQPLPIAQRERRKSCSFFLWYCSFLDLPSHTFSSSCRPDFWVVFFIRDILVIDIKDSLKKYHKILYKERKQYRIIFFHYLWISILYFFRCYCQGERWKCIIDRITGKYPNMLARKGRKQF